MPVKKKAAKTKATSKPARGAARKDAVVAVQGIEVGTSTHGADVATAINVGRVNATVPTQGRS